MGLGIPNIYRVYIGPAGSLDQYGCAGVAEEGSLARQPLLSVFRYYAITEGRVWSDSTGFCICMECVECDVIDRNLEVTPSQS